jgi:hypothetical protein
MNCPDRTPGCHGKCERYAEFAKEREAIRQKQYLDSISPDGARKTVENLLRKRRR